MAGERSEAIATIIEEAGGFKTIFTFLLEFTLILMNPFTLKIAKDQFTKNVNLIWWGLWKDI